MDYFLKSGLCGVAILLVTGFLAFSSILFLAVLRSRRVAVLFAVAAFLPLMIGISGTYMSERMIEEELRMEDALAKPKPYPYPDEVEIVGRQEAKIRTYMGLGGTALLLAISICGMVFSHQRPPGRP